MRYRAYQNCEFDKAYAMAKTRMDVESNKLCAGNQETCSVGCMFEGYRHELSKYYYNIYPQCTYALDAIYEGLPTKAESDQFHIDYYDAIPIGGDTKQAWHNFMSQLMLDPTHGAVVHDKTDSAKTVGLLHLRAASGDMPTKGEWSEAVKAASAAKAAVVRVMIDIRRNADAHYQWQRDTLLQCLRDC